MPLENTCHSPYRQDLLLLALTSMAYVPCYQYLKSNQFQLAISPNLSHPPQGATNIIRTLISFLKFTSWYVGISANIRIGMTRYALGMKYCSKCEVYLSYNGIFYPCCGRQLRTKPLTKKGRKNSQVDL